MMIQKSIVTVLLVTSWLQSSMAFPLDSGVAQSSGGIDLLNPVIPETESLVAKPLGKRDVTDYDDDDDTSSLSTNSGTGVATVSDEHGDGTTDLADKDLTNVLERRHRYDIDSGKQLSSQDSPETETSHGETKVSLLNLRRRGLFGRRSHDLGNDDNSESGDGFIEQQQSHGASVSLLNLRRRGNSISLIGGGGLGGLTSQLGGLSGATQDVTGNGNGGTALGLRRRQSVPGVLELDHLVGSLLGEKGASTKRDSVSVASEQENDEDNEDNDDDDVEKVAKTRSNTSTSTNTNDTDDSNSSNDTDNSNNNSSNDTDNSNNNSSNDTDDSNNTNGTDDSNSSNDTDNSNSTNDTNESNSAKDTDDSSSTNDTDDSNNTNDTNDDNTKSNQALDHRAATLETILSVPSRVARARRYVYARDNDEDRRIMEDFENLLKEQEDRQKHIQEDNDNLLQEYGNEQYNGLPYGQQYQPFAGQQYQPFVGQSYQPFSQFKQSKKTRGSRLSRLNLRRGMTNNGLADKA